MLHHNKFILKNALIVLATLFHPCFALNTDTINCRPALDKQLPQFIVGYGSLMQENSKRRIDSISADNNPIYLTGFKRGWVQHGSKIGYSTTYLGVKPDAKARINAVYFKLSDPKRMDGYDKREAMYCRVSVDPKNIHPLTTAPLVKGQYWIYILKNDAPEQIPNSDYPIVQSYVDTFLSGCFELEEKFLLKHFARACIKTTSHWSDKWVNDRIYPRRAFERTSYASKIDYLLALELPEYFKKIKIE